MAKAALIVFSLLILHSCAVPLEIIWSISIDYSVKDPVTEFKSVKPLWLAAILRTDGEKKEYVCAGSFILEDTVITSAKCVQNLQPYGTIVRYGEWDIPNAKENVHYFDRNVSRIIVHEEFRLKSHHNNIALLKVVGDVNLTKNMAFVATTYVSYNYSDCHAIGWGGERYEEGAILKKINLPLVEHNNCQNNLRKTHLGSYFQLHESFLCAGGEGGEDTCSSDGGMPLMCKSDAYDDFEEIMGIVSWNIGCGQENVPGVYVNVSHFFSWISSISY